MISIDVACAGEAREGTGNKTAGEQFDERQVPNRELKLVVVEDELLVRMDLEMCLRELGHKVMGVAQHSAEALDLIARLGDQIDGVLLDIKLANETARRVRRELDRRGIPYVFVTAYARADARSMGFSGPLIEKPLSSTALREAVTKYFT